MATYQLSNTAEQIDNFVSGYIFKDSTNKFNLTQNSFVCGGLNNVASGVYSIVGGGLRNTGHANYTTVFGGQNNLASGINSSILGGRNNKTLGNYSFIGAGDGNKMDTLNSITSVIVGGDRNEINGLSTSAVIVGGSQNTGNGNYSTIAGGLTNRMSSIGSAIGGGRRNYCFSNYSAVAGGDYNSILVGTNGHSFIGGGISNTIGKYDAFYTLGYATIAGGQNNVIYTNHGFIGGGNSNKLLGSVNNPYNVICGGFFNEINSSEKSVICGGYFNKINASETSVICGGTANEISNWHNNGILGGIGNVLIGGTEQCFSFGYYNKISGCTNSIVLGGADNEIYGYRIPYYDPGGEAGWIQEKTHESTIIGGSSNQIVYHNSCILNSVISTTSGEYSNIIGGRNVNIPSGHDGAMVLADGQDRERYSKGSQTCLLDFANGVYLRLPSFTGSKNQEGNLGELKVSGQYLYIATGQDTWGRVQISSF